MTHAKHSHKIKDKTVYTKPQAFKVHMLEQESIRALYRNRLKGKLTPLTAEIDTDWLKIKEAITKAAEEESIGYKKWKTRKWLRTWNEEIQRAIDEKKASYRKYLQNKTVDYYIEYKTPSNSKENYTKSKKRRLGQICEDIRKRHNRNTKTGFKIFKQLQMQERDKLKIDPITKTEWKEYYGKTLE